MNRRCISLIFAVTAMLILAAIGWLVPFSRTTEAAPAPSSDAAFKGKVLLVNTSNMAAFLLETAQVQKLGERSFLVGKGTAEGRIGGWYKGRMVRIQMEHVVSITEFDDLKEARKALESGGGALWGGYAGPAVQVEGGDPLPGVAPVAPPPPPAKKP